MCRKKLFPHETSLTSLSFFLPPPQIFDENTKKLLFSITFSGPEMLLKKLPSDTKFIMKVSEKWAVQNKRIALHTAWLHLPQKLFPLRKARQVKHLIPHQTPPQIITDNAIRNLSADFSRVLTTLSWPLFLLPLSSCRSHRLTSKARHPPATAWKPRRCQRRCCVPVSLGPRHHRTTQCHTDTIRDPRVVVAK